MEKLLFVDDHPVVQYGMKSFLSRHKLFDEIDLAATGTEAIELCEKAQKSEGYRMIIMDINLPDYEIIALVKAIRKIAPEAALLMFSMEAPKMYLKRLLELGIRGFIEKTSLEDELLFAIERIRNGKDYFSSDLLADLLNHQEGDTPEILNGLSERESEILSMMIGGKTSQEIADALNLHKSSISTYRTRIFQKLGVKNNFDLYRWALREGLIYPD